MQSAVGLPAPSESKPEALAHGPEDVTLPLMIHLIWLGDNFREKYKNNLKQWARLNPSHTVKLWINRALINDETFSALQVGLRECSNIKIKDIETELKEDTDYQNLKAWIKLLEEPAAPGVPNYGAASDIYRILILKRYGGWYFDTDITPLHPLPVLMPKYGFIVHADVKGGKLSEFSPEAIFAVPQGQFISKAIEILRALHAGLTPDILSLPTSNEVGERFLATYWLSGSVLQRTCSKLGINWKEIEKNAVLAPLPYDPGKATDLSWMRPEGAERSFFPTFLPGLKMTIPPPGKPPSWENLKLPSIQRLNKERDKVCDKITTTKIQPLIPVRPEPDAPWLAAFRTGMQPLRDGTCTIM